MSKKWKRVALSEVLAGPRPTRGRIPSVGCKRAANAGRAKNPLNPPGGKEKGRLAAPLLSYSPQRGCAFVANPPSSLFACRETFFLFLDTLLESSSKNFNLVASMSILWISLQTPTAQPEKVSTWASTSLQVIISGPFGHISKATVLKVKAK